MSSSENENYEGKDPMSPEKITSHEPTAVKRDQEIDETEQIGTDRNIGHPSAALCVNLCGLCV